MNKLLTLVLVVAAVVAAGVVFAVQHLPWWWSAALIAGLLVIAALLFKVILRALMMIPFRMKGAVLENATAEVHFVTPASAPLPEPPSDDPDLTPEDRESMAELGRTEQEDLAGRRFYELDVTITPRPASGRGFAHWEPGELMLVRPGAKADLESLDEEDELCVIKNCEIAQDGQWQSDEVGKYPGPQRLRLLIGVRPGVGRLKFRYYFSLFGNVEIPDVREDD